MILCTPGGWRVRLLFSSLQALTGECGFLAANLYARSIFGEDALANLSIEKPVGSAEEPVQGHIRIRAKTQVTMVTWLLFIKFYL